MADKLLLLLMRKKNDILLKAAFEESFPDLLRFFFKEADAVFDMEKGFVFMDKELNELSQNLKNKVEAAL